MYALAQHTRLKRLVHIGLISIFVLAASLVAIVPKASAAYDGSNLIENQLFLDARSMSSGDIQNLLVSNGSGLASRNFVLNCYGPTSTERQWYSAVGAPCDQSIPASQIIFYAGVIYGVSPKVILATMQKEQSLVTAVNPTDWQINQAMGYGCPTTGQCGGNSTFFYQIDSGTWALRYHFERANGNNNWWNAGGFTCGTPKQFYNPGLYPGNNVTFYDENGVAYRTLLIANAATAAFYCYTPHTYNNPQGLYGRPPYGTTGMYYSGSYNFVYWYERWFGATNFDPDKDYDSDAIINRFDICKQSAGTQLYQGCPQNSLNETGDMSGDFNGDGFDDILVFSAFNDSKTYNLWFYPGSATGFGAPVFQRTLGPAFGGWDFSVSKPVVANINNDQFDDLVIFHRGPNDEVVRHVLLGSAGGIQPSSGAWVAWQFPSQGWKWSNVRIVGAGDVNGDNFDDVVAMSVNPDGHGSNIWSFNGSATQLQNPVLQQVLLPSDTNSWDFNRSKATVGNINGDAYDDVVIFKEGFVNEVTRYILPGSAGGVQAANASYTVTLNTSQGWKWSNVRIVGAGDVNGDGFDDIVALSGFPDNTTFNLWVFRGSASSGLTGPDFQRTLGPAFGGWQLARSKPILLNANGDTYADLAILHQGPGNEVVQQLLKGSNSGLQAPDSNWVTWQFPSQGWLWSNIRIVGSGN